MDVAVEIGKIIGFLCLCYFIYDFIFRSLLIPLFDPDGFGMNLKGLYKTIIAYYSGAILLIIFSWWLMNTQWGLAIAIAPLIYFSLMGIPYYYKLLQRVKNYNPFANE